MELNVFVGTGVEMKAGMEVGRKVATSQTCRVPSTLATTNCVLSIQSQSAFEKSCLVQFDVITQAKRPNRMEPIVNESKTIYK